MRETRTFSRTEFNFTYEGEAYTDDGKVWRWTSNDHCVPMDAAEDYGIPVDAEAQQAALKVEFDQFLEKYRANPPKMTPEMMFEARAAHGPGVVLQDVFTGHKFTT